MSTDLPGPIFEYIARVRLRRPPLSPQGRAGRAVWLLMKRPMRSDELTQALGYSGRFSVYDLLRNISQSGVPLYYDEETSLWGILGRVYDDGDETDRGD